MMLKWLGKILNVQLDGFYTYMRREWPKLGEKEDSMYLTSKYTQKRDKTVSRKIRKGKIELVHKLLFEYVNKCVLPR